MSTINELTRVCFQFDFADTGFDIDACSFAIPKVGQNVKFTIYPRDEG